MRKIVITGGAGFIGSHLAELLVGNGDRVTIIDNLSTGRMSNISSIESKLQFIEADLCVRGDWESSLSGADCVIHLAALADIVPSISEPLKYFHANVSATAHIVEACRLHGVGRIVYAASSSCYGIPNRFPTAEDTEIKPRYPYALTKWLGEELVLHWGDVYKVPTISLRLFNVYGSRSRTSGTYGAMFGVFLAQKANRYPLTIVGDGNQSRDFTFVTDVVSAFNKAISCRVQHPTVINIGSGQPVTVRRITELIGGPVVNIPKRPGEPEITHALNHRARDILGWSAQISIERGVEMMMKELDNWTGAPVWTPEKIDAETKEWFLRLS